MIQSVPLKNVYVYDDNSEAGWCGFDDNHLNYAFIKRRKEKYKLSPSDQGCDIYNVTASYDLIIDVNNKVSDADFIFRQRLLETTFGIITLTTFDDDSREIYKRHTGSEWKDCNNKLYEIGFTLRGTTDCNCYDIPCLKTDL